MLLLCHHDKYGSLRRREGGSEGLSAMQSLLPLTDQGHGSAVLQGRNSRPLPCAFLAGAVADLGQQVCAVGVPVLEDVSCDLNQEGVQLCLVPVFKSLSASVSRHKVRLILFAPS